MSKWVLRTMRTRIKATSYPAGEEAGGISPGLPLLRNGAGGDPFPLSFSCPTKALRSEGGQGILDRGRCIHCFRCHRGPSGFADWDDGYEWAAVLRTNGDPADSRGKTFGRSLRIRFVDGGACGACLNEIEQISKPYYNSHRRKFCITPAPHEADILMVAGPFADQLRFSIQETYESMPSPKLVLAIGACALTGGIFHPGFCGSGVPECIPIDIGVPGCPPPPLAIIHGLLLATFRRFPASLALPKPVRKGNT